MGSLDWTDCASRTGMASVCLARLKRRKDREMDVDGKVPGALLIQSKKRDRIDS